MKDLAIEDIEGTIKDLVAAVPVGFATSPMLTGGRVWLSVGLFDLRGTGDMWELPPELLRVMADRRIHLSVDAYGS